MLTLMDVRLRRGPQVLIDGAHCTIFRGERVGIVGRNGCGKSTLLALIRGDLAPDAGEYRAPPALAIAAVAQELPETDATVVEYIRGGDLELAAIEAQMEKAGQGQGPTASYAADGTALGELERRGGPEQAHWSELDRRNHLGRFGFRGERVFEPTRHFSGGERARLALAILVARKPNLLLLDEPTNHLDLDMRHALLVALQEFAGAVVIVSHDRALLRGACDQFLLVADGAVSPFDGDLEDYAAWLARGADGARRQAAADSTAPAPDPSGSGAPSGPSRREQRRLEAEARNRLTPLRAEQRRLESQLERLTAERQELEARLADPATYGGATVADPRRLSARHGELLREISAVEERWLEVASALGEGGVFIDDT